MHNYVLLMRGLCNVYDSNRWSVMIAIHCKIGFWLGDRYYQPDSLVSN